MTRAVILGDELNDIVGPRNDYETVVAAQYKSDRSPTTAIPGIEIMFSGLKEASAKIETPAADNLSTAPAVPKAPAA